ncbi:MAG: hypothetical protein JOZ47_08315 [Kutzneria sp.]|nr:hypothetical protein [Kutzneria sp.]MBV9845058.1 hypothetical protein [Kutzneria sp.]
MTTAASDPVTPTARPRVVTAGIALWGVSAVLYLGTGLGLLVYHGSLVDYASHHPPSGTKLSPQQLVDAFTVQLRVLEVAFVVLSVLAAVFTYRLWAGRRRARVALTVLGLVDLLFSLLEPSLFTQVGTVIGLVGLLLLYLPKAGAYFAALGRT